MPPHKNKFMLRRALAISFIFLANIILLAVAVVPHHHHGDMICFAAPHNCGQKHDADCSDQHNPSHSHDRHNDATCCNIEEWLLPNITSGDKHNISCFCAMCNNGYDLFAFIIPGLPGLSPQTECLPFKQAPFTEKYISVYVSQTPGLRAPPCC